MNAPLRALTSAGYTITDADNTRYGEPIGCVTDALTGVTTAHYAGGQSVPLGVKLCGGCDRPLEHGHCAACSDSIEARLSRSAFVANVRARIAIQGESA